MTVICIGGPPRAGKTTLARKLSKKLGYSYIPGDYIKCIINEYTDKEEILKLNNDERYLKFSAEEIFDAYIESANKCWQGFWAFIQYAISDNYDFIIEGYPILPELINSKFKDNKDIVSIFLGKEDENKIYEGVIKSTCPNDRLKLNCKDETIVKASKMISIFSKEIKKQANKYLYNYYNLDNNYSKTLEKIIKKF